MKTKKVLFNSLFSKRLIFLLPVLIIASFIFSPATLKDAITDYVISIFGEELLAQDNEKSVSSSSNSQKMTLLEAPVTPNLSRKSNGESITTVAGTALLSEVGPSGTLVNVDGANDSDQISIYIVRQGDTLSSIAKMFDVSSNTILWANEIKGGLVKPGDQLVILPVSGVRHTVIKGDTITSIGKKYNVNPDEIAHFNDITVSKLLELGDRIIVPDGELEVPKIKPALNKKSLGKNLDSYFIRPIVGGKKTQGVHGHNGVDLASPYGTSIRAAASGVVIVSQSSGYNGGYGKFIVVSHSNGTQTLYAHLSENLVTSGQKVSKGEVIAKMGSSGRSTGSHLHFEVHGARNPF